VLGPDHVTTLTAAITVVVTLIGLGEADRARALGEGTLPRCRRVFGLAHPITKWAATALNVALIGLDEAEPIGALVEGIAQRCRRAFGPDHPITQYVTQVADSSRPWLEDDAP
jgi:hypothetical protein